MGSFVSLGAYTWLSSLLLTVVNAALVGVVGWLLIKFLLGFIAKFLKKTKIDPLLHTVILSVTKIALLVLLAISVLDKLGIPTTSIITSLGAVGLAISLAVKDSIATLAGGVVILVLKPFNLGDYVEIDGLGGTVREITMFNTVLNTPDNKRISLPNDSVYKAKVVNYSAEPNRRLDLVFTIGYNDDYDKAKALIEKVIRDCPLALDYPAPVVRMSGHGASAIEITTRVWVKNSDYFELQFRMSRMWRRASIRMASPFPLTSWMYISPRTDPLPPKDKNTGVPRDPGIFLRYSARKPVHFPMQIRQGRVGWGSPESFPSRRARASSSTRLR